MVRDPQVSDVSFEVLHSQPERAKYIVLCPGGVWDWYGKWMGRRDDLGVEGRTSRGEPES